MCAEGDCSEGLGATSSFISDMADMAVMGVIGGSSSCGDGDVWWFIVDVPAQGLYSVYHAIL